MRRLLGLLAIVLTVAACAPAPGGGGTAPNAQDGQRPAAVKRITAAIRGGPASMVQQKIQRGSSVRGLDGIEELVHAGLTYIKGDGTRAAQLAEAVPTVENGLWKIFPDGRMETTWKIKSGARWHDGAPITADDFVFTAIIEQDKETEIPAYPEYEMIEAITAVDPSTLVVTWKRTYIEADGIFSYRAAGLPVPKHLMERVYLEDKSSFSGHPYWTDDWVGAGAFRIREWVRDSHTVLRASDSYIFGRPKIDEIEVRFIPDNNALTANILAGGDLTLGKTISLDIALQVRDGWRDGRMLILPQNWTPINPQFTNPTPAIVADLRFRRALLHALDRQQLADFVFSGHGSVAHSYVDPSMPHYNVVDPLVVKYDYDLRRTAQIMEEIGYGKRGDGFYYDAAGQRLQFLLQAPIQNDIHPKTVPAVADMWQRAGFTVDQTLTPIQMTQDREARAQYPAFEIIERRNSLAVSEVYRFHSSMTPMPENRYTAGGVSRYRSAELDAWIERYLTTIPMVERMQAMGGMVQHQTENLSQLPLFHGADPTLVSNRLQNVTARGDNFTQAWNVQDWELR
jgi:peptide/nickel transport system substrate-binding protein